MAERKKLFLLDAFALIYRAYYSLGKAPALVNSKGMNVTAISVFTNVLYNLLKDTDATHFGVVFDHPDGTDRAAEHDFYKANREAMPEDIQISIPYIKEIIAAFNIPMVELAGYEADDLIGTLAKMAEKENYDVYMVTPDKDFAQLVSDNIFMYKPQYRGKGYDVLGVNEIKEKWEVEHPEQVIDILGMWGDSVDNIPGIPGIGEKTAKKLVAQFGSLEGVLENSDQLKGKMKENVENFSEQAIISKQLATIILDAPIEFHEEDLEIGDPNKEELSRIFSELEFRTLGKRILGDDYNVVDAAAGSRDLFNQNGEETETAAPQKARILSTVKHDYKLVKDKKGRAELLKQLLKAKEVCFDTETTGVDANNCELVGLAFSFKKGTGYYVPVPEDQKETKSIIDEFTDFFHSDKVTKIAHNLKFDMLVLKWYDMEIKAPYYDTMIAHYLVRPEMRHGMDLLAESYLDYKPQSIEELIGKKGKNQGSMRDVEVEKVVEYAAEDADITFQLKGIFDKELKDVEVEKLFEEVENPLVEVLAEMEYHGVGLDVKFLEKYSKELGEEVVELQDSIFKQAGLQFNLNSPKQLGEVLFDQMKIPYEGKKTKTGQYSTSEDVLSKLAGEHEIINDILGFREVSKLKSTYVDSLPQLINPKTGRIHSSFRQAVVPTGRLSSDHPNLQNIPIRTERGRKIRTAFIPESKDMVLFAADYSQVELRIIADLANDKNMIKAFEDGEDIHSSTASKVFGVPLKDVDREMRRKAKAVNFGLAYGQSAFGLAQSLGISRSEAREIIDNYFEKYPGIHDYMDESVAFAKKHGYAKTILGRKRNLPDINSKNHTVRSFAERNAINTPIQGSAADIIKKAMIDIHEGFATKKFRSRMILQVHDELVFEVYKDELDAVKDFVVDKMSGAIKLKVPLVVDTGTGMNWLEAH